MELIFNEQIDVKWLLRKIKRVVAPVIGVSKLATHNRHPSSKPNGGSRPLQTGLQIMSLVSIMCLVSYFGKPICVRPNGFTRHSIIKEKYFLYYNSEVFGCRRRNFSRNLIVEKMGRGLKKMQISSISICIIFIDYIIHVWSLSAQPPTHHS